MTSILLMLQSQVLMWPSQPHLTCSPALRSPLLTGLLLPLLVLFQANLSQSLCTCCSLCRELPPPKSPCPLISFRSLPLLGENFSALSVQNNPSMP